MACASDACSEDGCVGTPSSVCDYKKINNRTIQFRVGTTLGQIERTSHQNLGFRAESEYGGPLAGR
jgi:hypothetical protein